MNEKERKAAIQMVHQHLKLAAGNWIIRGADVSNGYAPAFQISLTLVRPSSAGRMTSGDRRMVTINMDPETQLCEVLGHYHDETRVENEGLSLSQACKIAMYAIAAVRTEEDRMNEGGGT